MTDLAKRVVVSVLLALLVFFLGAFAFGQWKTAQAAAAENERLTEVNAAITDTLTLWRDSLVIVGAELDSSLATNDSLAQRTGPIQWRTRTVELPGTIDTVPVFRVDTVPVVIIDAVPVSLPIVVARELEACRVLTSTCALFKHVADSTVAWYQTSVDSLQGQVDHLSKPNSFGVLGVTLPVPDDVVCGIGGGYSVTTTGETLSGTRTIDGVTVSGEVTTNPSPWVGMVGCVVGVKVF